MNKNISSPHEGAALLASDSLCGRLLPKPALIGVWQWEADGCTCALPPVHDGKCKCTCWIEKGL